MHEPWLEGADCCPDRSRMSRPDHTEAKARFFKLLKAGTSVAVAAREVDVHHSVGYYWVKKARKTVAPVAVRFAELKLTAPVHTSLELAVGKVTIRIEPGFDGALLREAIAALSGGEQ